MNKRKSAFIQILFVLMLSASSAMAADTCFVDDFGDFFRLSGGKIGNKAFAVEWLSEGCGSVPGFATTIRNSDGNVVLGIETLFSEFCSGVVWSFLGDRNLTQATGNFDNLPRNIGPYTADAITQVDCSSLPRAKSLNRGSRLPHTPGKEN